MIEFTHGTMRFKVQPNNAQRVRAALDSIKPARRTILRRKPTDRVYPVFKPGMTTAEYIRRFVGANDSATHLIPCPHECTRIDQPAPMLDGTIPEVWEEPDPDYVATITTMAANAARYTLADARAAVRQALTRIDSLDIADARSILQSVLSPKSTPDSF